MTQDINIGFIEACLDRNFTDVKEIYQKYLTHPSDSEDSNQLDFVLDHNIIDLLFICFKNVSSLEIMEWLYAKLDKLINHQTGLLEIFVPLEEIHDFWVETFKNAAYQGDRTIVNWLFDRAKNHIFGFPCHHEETDEPIKNLVKSCLTQDEYGAFRNACSQGQVETAELIYDLGYLSGHPINLHTNKQWVFYWGCQSGQLEMVKWLYHKAHSIQHPFTNVAEVYHLLNDNRESLSGQKQATLEWLTDLIELEGIATDWNLVDLDMIKELC